MIYIFTIATNIYSKYLDTYIDTLINIFPNQEKKLVLISDKNFYSDKIEVFNYHIPDSNYAICTLQKYIFIYDSIQFLNLSLTNNDRILFTDVDVYFAKKSKQYWDELYSKLFYNDISLSIFPWNYNNTNKYIKMEAYKTNSIALPQKFEFNVISAGFLFCNLYWLEQIYNKINTLMKYDLANIENNCRIIPNLPEQEYLNKVIQENLINYNTIWIDYFIVLDYDYYLSNFNISLNEFLEQNSCCFIIKYNSDIKYLSPNRNFTIETMKNELNEIYTNLNNENVN